MPRKTAKEEAANTGIRVMIVGKHPHAGTAGTIACKDGNVTVTNLFGTDMYRVELDENPTGTDACFAEKSKLRLLGAKPKAKIRANSDWEEAGWREGKHAA